MGRPVATRLTFTHQGRNGPLSGGIEVTCYRTFQKGVAALAAAAALAIGAGSASAATVQVTIDFGTGAELSPVSPYIEDTFEIAGSTLYLNPLVGKPARSVILDFTTPTLTLTRVGGGAFSLVSFDYTCIAVPGCDFSVGDIIVTGASVFSSGFFTTIFPTDLQNITSLEFFRRGSIQWIDNIVLTYDEDLSPIPLPAGLPLLLGGLAGLGLMAGRKRRAA